MSFPIVSNNTFYSLGRNNCSLRNAGEWDNVHFIEKGISLSADKTINSLAYNSGETAPYPNNLVLGAGRTLTIRSGGLIMARTGRWLGCTQTSKFAENGTVAFGGKHAYVFSDFGIANGDNGNEYNAIFASMVATNGWVKGGCGELVIAADQRGIDGTVWVNGGTLWLGHPAFYRQKGWIYTQNSSDIPARGCAMDVERFSVHAGGVLGVPLPGYDADGNGTVGVNETAIPKDAVIELTDNLAGPAKVEIAPRADQTCLKLFVNGRSLPRGTYGASGSDAEFADDVHFAGTGVLTVRTDELRRPTIVILM